MFNKPLIRPYFEGGRLGGCRLTGHKNMDQLSHAAYRVHFFSCGKNMKNAGKKCFSRTPRKSKQPVLILAKLRSLAKGLTFSRLH